MPRASDTLHAASLHYMQRLIQCLLVMPPACGPQMLLKLLYNGLLAIYLVYITQWRISFKYDVIYDRRKDTFSHTIDMVNYMGLVVTHFVLVMELFWRNGSAAIEQDLQHLLQELDKQLGHQVDLARIRRYAKSIFSALLWRFLAFTIFAAAYNLIFNHSRLLICAFYSELVLLMRFSEFSLYCALVLAFYKELYEAGTTVMLQLQLTRHDAWSKRKLALQHLATLQQLHGLLWEALRKIENNFGFSLVLLVFMSFMSISVLPYWYFMNESKQSISFFYLMVIEFCKLTDLIAPCLLCTQCQQLQRRFRSLFYSPQSDRRNPQLNAALRDISEQLGHETCYFNAGGFFYINNEMLGKFLFAVVSYIVICIQFRMSMKVDELKYQNP